MANPLGKAADVGTAQIAFKGVRARRQHTATAILFDQRLSLPVIGNLEL